MQHIIDKKQPISVTRHLDRRQQLPVDSPLIAFSGGIQSSLFNLSTTDLKMDTIGLNRLPNSLIFNLAGTGALCSVGLVLVGIINPQIGYQTYGFPDPTLPLDRRTNAELTRFWASRELYMGIVACLAWYHGERKSLGWMYILSAGVVVSDGIMKQRLSGGAWKHVMWVPLLVGLGVGLVGGPA